MKLLITLCLVLFSVDVYSEAVIDFSKKLFELSDEPIDVVIPACPKDINTLECCIEGIRENCENIRRIIVVSESRLTDSAEWYDEKLYPFSILDIAIALMRNDVKIGGEFWKESKGRVGWYYQQMLKYYAPFVIPDISSNVLVVDSDVIFLNRVEFLNPMGGALLNTNKEYYREYFQHAARLLPGFKRLYPQYSGISHHMLMQRPILEDLMSQVENHHGMKFWKAFCNCVSLEALIAGKSGASEYEIYFNFALRRTDQVEIRSLWWEDTPYFKERHQYKACGYHYIAVHEWLRKVNGVE